MQTASLRQPLFDPAPASGFRSAYSAVLRRPVRGFERLAAAPRRLRYGAYAIALTALVYQLVYFFLAHNGGRPTVFKPWLAIPAESYYRSNQYFIVPSILLGWIAAAGCAQLAARLAGGKGTYEDTLAALGLGISVSSWWTGLHDLITTALGFFGLLNQRAYEDAMSTPGTAPHALIWSLMVGYMLWFLLTFTGGARAAQRLGPVPGAITGAVGVLVYQSVFLLFNR